MAYPMGPGYAMTRIRDRDKIVDYLVHNHGDILARARVYKKQRDELLTHNSKDWQDKIREQYIHIVMYEIAEMITMEYGIDTETIITFFESFDFEQYIDGMSCDLCL
jgi:uncharacterized protein YnzC (UPF0291/DUF896 family)